MTKAEYEAILKFTADYPYSEEGLFPEGKNKRLPMELFKGLIRTVQTQNEALTKIDELLTFLKEQPQVDANAAQTALMTISHYLPFADSARLP